jgi:hypothetical protein
MKSSSDIPIPKHLRRNPQWRGLPIPYIALIKPDGQPDFRVTDEAARRHVMQTRRCQLCGDPLGKWVFFVGGMASAVNNAYFEPACHLDCLLYAMQVCPFIVGRIDHADTAKIEAANPEVMVKVDSSFSAKREPLWVIKKAINWAYIYSPDKTLLIRPYTLLATVPLEPETMSADDWARVREALL